MYEAGATFTLQLAFSIPAIRRRFTNRRNTCFISRPSLRWEVIYYWSTTAKGIRRATLDGRGASDYLTPSTGLTAAQALALDVGQQTARCVACHTMSRSGKKMSVSLPGDRLGVVEDQRAVPPPFTYASASMGAYGADAVIGASWVAFNPEENKVIVASTGHTLDSRHLGRSRGPFGRGCRPPRLRRKHARLVPDGQHIAFAATPSSLPAAKMARHIRGSSIAWMTASGNTFDGLS